MVTLFGSKTTIEIILAGFKQPFCFGSVAGGKHILNTVAISTAFAVAGGAMCL